MFPPSSRLSIIRYFLLQLAVLPFAHCQSQFFTLSLPFFDSVDDQTIVASVVSAQQTAAVYLVGCPSAGSEDGCGFAVSGATITAGGSFYDFYMAEPTQATVSLHCTLTGTTVAQCTRSLGGVAANEPGISTLSYTGTQLEYLPVTITAGLSNLIVPTTTTSTSEASLSTTAATSNAIVVSSTTGVTSSSQGATNEQNGPTASATTASIGFKCFTIRKSLPVGISLAVMTLLFWP